MNACQLVAGNQLSSHAGEWVAVESVENTGKYETVYNLRVADYSTYFVGGEAWGFSVCDNVCFERYVSAAEVLSFVLLGNNFSFSASRPNAGLRFALAGTIDPKKLTKKDVDEKYGYRIDFSLLPAEITILVGMGVRPADGHPGSLEIKPQPPFGETNSGLLMCNLPFSMQQKRMLQLPTRRQKKRLNSCLFQGAK